MAFSPAVMQVARRGRGLTQEELAAVLGCSVSVVQKWERGERRPSPDNQLRIAGKLRVAVEDLNPQPEPQPVSAA